MKKYALLLLSISLIVLSCQKTIDPINETPQPEVQPVQKSAIVEQNNNFSFNIFNQLAQNCTTNIFISPLSIYYSLSMSGIGSDGNTHAEFASILGWQHPNDSLFLPVIKNLYSEIKPVNSNITIEIANSVWQREIFNVYDSYRNNLVKYFDAEANTIDFRATNAINIINSWIETKTNQKITNVLDNIPVDAVMYLINAIYFKADWYYNFDEKNTQKGTFYITTNNTVEVDYMKQSAIVKHIHNQQINAVVLPYIDTAYAMVVCMPGYGSNFNELKQNLTAANWQNWLQQATYNKVDITLPKFKFGYGSRDIKPELIALGLNDAFTLNADFSKISDIPLFINRVLHKSFIDVNEKGSEAAAVTVVEIFTTGENYQPTFRANQPFIFAILHQPTNTILFMGLIIEPEYK